MPVKPILFPELLITRRLALRRHSADIAPLLFTVIDTERARIGQFLPWAQQIKTLEDERTFVKNSRQDWDDGRMFDYGMYDSRSNEFIGCIGMHTIRWEHECCEIGFWLSAKFEGQGLMSEALLGLEDEIFSTGFHRIEVRCDRKNERSAKVAERCGYHLDGVLRENLVDRGAYRDTMIWGKLYRS